MDITETDKIKKIDEENLEITNTTESKRILPKADIERNIANIEADLVRANNLLEYFNDILTEGGSSQQIYTEEELYALTKEEQITILNSYGVFDIPQYEEGRVNKILELQNG